MLRNASMTARHVVLRLLVGVLPLVAATAALIAGCATNPVTGRKEFSLVSSEQELQIGKEGHAAVLAEYGSYPDDRLQAYVDSIGLSLARHSHQPNLDWHFTLIDDPVVNAFALPGGYIYITRGILAHLGSEAQLAGVLGHEIGHVTARHSAQRITSQQLAGLGLGLASVLVEGFSRYGKAAETALSLMFLKYGRDDENEADMLGVRYSTASGYDPREIPNTYVLLARVGARSGQSLPTFLSTHPDPGDRQTRTTQLAQDAAAGKTGLIVRAKAHLDRLDGVVFGNDPRHGYFQGTAFYHPQLQFQMSFPGGWQTRNTRQAVLAAAPDQQGVMQLTLAKNDGLAPAQFVDRLIQNRQVLDARGARERIGGYDAWVGRLAVQRQDGTQGTLAAAFILKSDQMFQILGQGGEAGESAALSAARSFRPLTDPARLNVQPDRLDLVTAPSSGAFKDVVAAVKPQALSLEDTAILNNVELEDEVRRGETIKVVRPGSYR